jgi:uncharacterized protein (UPF0297 family)
VDDHLEGTIIGNKQEADSNPEKNAGTHSDTDVNLGETMMFHSDNEDGSAREILEQVHKALLGKGYDPINQLVGYLMSGDPVYITSHDQARTKIRRIERYELLEELVRNYLKTLK